MDFYKSVERLRLFHFGLLGWGLVSLTLGAYLGFLREAFWTVLFFASGLAAVFNGHNGLRECWTVFCRHGILAVAARMHRDKLTDGIWLPKFRRFLWAGSLEKFEAEEIKRDEEYRAKIKDLEKTKRTITQHLYLLESEKTFAGQLDDLAQQEGIDPHTLDRFGKTLWRVGFGGFARKRALIQRFLSAKSQAREHTLAQELEEVQRQVVSFDHSIVSSSVKDLIERAGRESRLSKKVKLLRRAVKALRRNETLDTEVADALVIPEAGQDDRAVPSRSAQFLSLPSVVEERLDLSRLLPPDVDSVMVKQILVALLDPGRDAGIFGGNYRPGDTLKRRVVSQYRSRVKRPFSPKGFRESLQWLGRHGVILSKAKTNEMVYSLNSRSANASSEIGKALIRAIIEFDRGLHQS